MQKYLWGAIGLGLILMAMMAFQQGKPSPKAPIYKEIKKYSPYYIDKRFGGLQIMSKKDEDFKEKPDNIDVFHRLDFLDREWGKKHLKIDNSQLVILDDNGTEITKFPITTQADSDFLHSFYGI